MEIKLNKVKEFIIHQAITNTIDTIVIREIVDNSKDRRVVAYSNAGDIELWVGDEL